MTARRSVLKGVLGFGLGLAAGPRVWAQGDPASARPREGDLFVKDGDQTLTSLTAGDVGAGAAPLQVWPMDPTGKIVRKASRLNRILLVRVEVAGLGEETRPLAADGVVAYTAICTHGGCEVDDWLPAERLLLCSCHSSQFDPRNGARVVDGPAPRSLPALPLKIVEGRLVVAGGFTTPVGFESA